MPDIVGWSAKEPLPTKVLDSLKSILNSGKIIVYPTNTLYGIGASIHSEAGIRAAHEAKKRPENIPFLIMASEEQIKRLCQIPEIAFPFFARQDILITAILPIKNVPDSIQHEGTLAVRLPCSELTRSIVEHIGPITSTSANLHGKEPPITCQEAMGQLGEDVAVYIDSGEVGGTPSTLIDFTGEKPKVIREGALSPDELRKIYG